MKKYELSDEAKNYLNFKLEMRKQYKKNWFINFIDNIRSLPYAFIKSH